MYILCNLDFYYNHFYHKIYCCLCLLVSLVDDKVEIFIPDFEYIHFYE